MKAIVKHPHERIGHYAEIPNDLKALQQAVDGHIETASISMRAWFSS